MRIRNSECGVRNQFIQQGIGVLAMLLAFSVQGVSVAERTWTRSEILAITDGKAKTLGYDTEHMSVSFDTNNSKWTDYLKQLGKTDRNDDAFRGHDYIAVYYAPLEKMTMGGDLWVFLDLRTGQVIETVAGE